MTKLSPENYRDLLPIRSLSFKEILYLTIVCFILTILISFVISMGIFNVSSPFVNAQVFYASTITGVTISYALGNYTIYKYYQGQKKQIK